MENYCVLDGQNFRCSEISITKEKIWSSNTRRTTSAELVGDIVGIKTKLVVKFPPMNDADAMRLESVVTNENKPFFSLQFIDPKTGQQATKTVYAGTPTYPLYSYADGLPRYVGVAVDLIEK